MTLSTQLSLARQNNLPEILLLTQTTATPLPCDVPTSLTETAAGRDGSGKGGAIHGPAKGESHIAIRAALGGVSAILVGVVMPQVYETKVRNRCFKRLHCLILSLVTRDPDVIQCNYSQTIPTTTLFLSTEGQEREYQEVQSMAKRDEVAARADIDKAPDTMQPNLCYIQTTPSSLGEGQEGEYQEIDPPIQNQEYRESSRDN